MTMLREGGAKVKKGGKETYKKATQAGIILDQQQFSLVKHNVELLLDAIRPLVGNSEFGDHIETAERLGFELLVKRAKIGRAKHVRVRPLFRNWVAEGSLTVVVPVQSGITEDAVRAILTQAGALCGLCDWRPSSGASGTFGKFIPEIQRV